MSLNNSFNQKKKGGGKGRELGEIALKSTNFKDFYECLVKEYLLPKQRDSF